MITRPGVRIAAFSCLRPALLATLWLRALPATLIALPIALAFVLLHAEPLHMRGPWEWVFIFCHALATAMLVQRFSSGAHGFLYTRGFTRDALWVHTVLAQWLAVLCVWLPAAMMLWLGVRARVQDEVLGNPWYPIMGDGDGRVAWAWFGGYALLLATFQYEAVRRSQPTRDGQAGTLLAVGVVGVGLTLMAEGFHAAWYGWLTYAALAITTFAMLLGGWRLHRTLEVHA